MGPHPSAVDGQITFLYTPDLDRASTFYGDALGLDLVLDQGGCRIYRLREGAHVGICRRPEAGAAPEAVILTIVTDDVDGWHEMLEGRGVVFDTVPRLNGAYGIYHCFLRDPDGHRLEIQRFLSADWRP